MAKILIVEDEAIIAFDVEELLVSAGHTVLRKVSSDSDALRTISELGQSIDAVVLDVNLGGKSSEMVAKRLYEMRIPFVIASGYSLEQIGPWARHFPRIQKPFASQALLDAVRNITNRIAAPSPQE